MLVDYSERAVRQVAAISKKYKIIHIDGGHLAHHVWADFLLYSKFLAEGGYLVLMTTRMPKFPRGENCGGRDVPLWHV